MLSPLHRAYPTVILTWTILGGTASCSTLSPFNLARVHPLRSTEGGPTTTILVYSPVYAVQEVVTPEQMQERHPEEDGEGGK